MNTLLPVKDPGETVVVVFDFSKEAASLTIGGSPGTSEVYWTTTADPNPSAVLSGAAVVSGTSVLQRVAGGVNFTDYALRCTATNQNGDVLVVAAILPVRRQPSP